MSSTAIIKMMGASARYQKVGHFQTVLAFRSPRMDYLQVLGLQAAKNGHHDKNGETSLEEKSENNNTLPSIIIGKWVYLQ